MWRCVSVRLINRLFLHQHLREICGPLASKLSTMLSLQWVHQRLLNTAAYIRKQGTAEPNAVFWSLRNIEILMSALRKSVLWLNRHVSRIKSGKCFYFYSFFKSLCFLKKTSSAEGIVQTQTTALNKFLHLYKIFQIQKNFCFLFTSNVKKTHRRNKR